MKNILESFCILIVSRKNRTYRTSLYGTIRFRMFFQKYQACKGKILHLLLLIYKCRV
nr:MAG TPA: hypothetical protein [Caudoviricetes sp.]